MCVFSKVSGNVNVTSESVLSDDEVCVAETIESNVSRLQSVRSDGLKDLSTFTLKCGRYRVPVI